MESGEELADLNFYEQAHFWSRRIERGTPPRQLQPKRDPECPLVAAQHRVKLRLPSELPAPQRGEPSRRAGWSARQRGSQSESGILCPLAPQLEGRGGEEGAAWGIMAARVLVLVAPLPSQLSAASTRDRGTRGELLGWASCPPDGEVVLLSVRHAYGWKRWCYSASMLSVRPQKVSSLGKMSWFWGGWMTEHFRTSGTCICRRPLGGLSESKLLLFNQQTNFLAGWFLLSFPPWSFCNCMYSF